MATQDQIKDRFTRAIKKSFRPCPLIGPKWFRFYASGEPADFQFIGCQKLAKAMGKDPRFVAQTIIRNLYLRDIDAAIEMTADARISLRFKKPLVGKNESSSNA